MTRSFALYLRCITCGARATINAPGDAWVCPTGKKKHVVKVDGGRQLG